MLDAALRFLEARPRSIAEVRRRLTYAGYREELVAGAVERLEGLGILDDQAFATQWVGSRDRARPRGERALRAELAQRGVDRAVVDEVLDDRRHAFEQSGAETDDDPGSVESADSSAAWRLLARRGRAIERISDPRVRRQRAFALLARNGFDSGLATDLASAWAAGVDAAAHGEGAVDENETDVDEP